MNVQNELQSCIYELNKIINELESIANAIRTEFEGIGEEYCSQAILEKTQQYRYSKRLLQELLYANSNQCSW